mgnify:CR=1 FL=1|jgi:hypothetical protein
METTTDLTGFVFKWLEECEKENVILTFKGDFNQELVNAILLLSQKDPDFRGSSTQIKARLFGIMVECMQNIRKYGAVNDTGSESKPGIIIVSFDGKTYGVKTGNLVENEKVAALEERLAEIKSLEKENIKQKHKEVLKTTRLSEKSGAGLGLLTIARKADGINFNFKKLNDRVSFFGLDINLNLDLN